MEKGTPTGIIEDFKKTPPFIRVLALLFLVALIGLGAYHWTVRTKLQLVQAEFASSTAEFQAMVGQLGEQLAQMTSENEELTDDLRSEKRRNDRFEDQIEEISGTVSVLDKLRKTDEELLKKYSKVSFLNEHYLPEGLKEIEKQFLATGSAQRIHVRVDPFLDDLLEDAKDDNIDLRVVSAYRSFGTQAALKSQYTVVYGTGANQFSADQGYSEHQLGTTVDFSTPALNGQLDGFQTTEAYQWLLEHAQRYGFVLSYPPNNAYYQFEPWHWRFVGVDLAKDLKRSDKYFYDMDQRDINEYLISIFD